MLGHGGARRTGLLAVITGALFADMMVYGLVVPFLPRVATQHGLTQTGTGFLFAMYALALLGGAWVMPALAARMGARSLLLAGLLGLMGSTLAFGGAESWTGLVVGRSLQGLSAASTWTVGPALLAHAFPARERGGAMGVAITGSGVGTLVGPPLGGFLYELGGAELPFQVAAAVALGVALGALLFVPRGTREEGARLPLRRLLTDGHLRRVGWLIVVASGVVALLEPVLPLWLERQLGASPLEIGLVFGAATLCYAVTSPLAGWWSDRWERLRVCRVGLVGMALLLPWLALAEGFAGVVGVMAGVGVMSALALAPAMPALADAVDRMGLTDYATGYVLFNVAYAVGMFGGPVLGSAVAERAGLGVALGATAVVSAGVAVLVLREGRGQGAG